MRLTTQSRGVQLKFQLVYRCCYVGATAPCGTCAHPLPVWQQCSVSWLSYPYPLSKTTADFAQWYRNILLRNEFVPLCGHSGSSYPKMEELRGDHVTYSNFASAQTYSSIDLIVRFSSSLKGGTSSSSSEGDNLPEPAPVKICRGGKDRSRICVFFGNR